MAHTSTAFVAVFGLLGFASAALPQSKKTVTPEVAFTKTVKPYMATYCVGCHNPKNKQANLDLEQYKTIESVRADLKVWRKVAWKLDMADMPPEKSPQPPASIGRTVLKWINSELEKAPAAAAK
jgi:hypothetical protein